MLYLETHATPGVLGNYYRQNNLVCLHHVHSSQAPIQMKGMDHGNRQCVSRGIVVSTSPMDTRNNQTQTLTESEVVASRLSKRSGEVIRACNAQIKQDYSPPRLSFIMSLR